MTSWNTENFIKQVPLELVLRLVDLNSDELRWNKAFQVETYELMTKAVKFDKYSVHGYNLAFITASFYLNYDTPVDSIMVSWWSLHEGTWYGIAGLQ